MTGLLHKKRALALLAGLTAIAVAGFGVRGFSRWWSQSLTQAARVQLAAGRLPEALQNSRRAVRLDSNNPSARRLLAATLDATQAEDAPVQWQQVLALPGAGDEDRTALARSWRRVGQLEAADRALAPLLARPAPPLHALDLGAELANDRQDHARAAALLERFCALAPEDRPRAFLLAQALLAQGQPHANASARAVLTRLAFLHPGDATTRRALRLLVQRFPLDPAESARARAAFGELPSPTLEESLLRQDLELAAHPADAPTIFAGIVERARASSPADQLSFARWLNARGQFGLTAALITPTAATADQHALVARLDALAGLGHWPQVRELLAAVGPDFDPASLALYRARTFLALGDRLQADLQAARALHAAANSAQLAAIAGHLERLGWTDYALTAYTRLANDPAHTAPAVRRLIDLAERTADTNRLLGILRAVEALRPGDAAPRNDRAYLSLLLDREVPAAVETAEQLVKGQPGVLAYRVTLALGYLRQNRPGESLALLNVKTIEWSKIRPTWRAIYAAALASAGQVDQARAELETVPLDRLRPEERALIRHLKS